MRCEQIRSLVADPTISDYDRSKAQERPAKSSGGAAVINAGGASEVEIGETKDRYDDALNDTRAGVEEGILPGGGAALLVAVGYDEPLERFGMCREGCDPDSDCEPRSGAWCRYHPSPYHQPARTMYKNAEEESSGIVGRILSGTVWRVSS